MTSLDLTIVVVSYNTREMTLACLRSVFLETKQSKFAVVVLDNASTDGSAEAISREFGDRVQLIVSKENLGFAAGNNVAALNSAGDYLLLLNPDTVVLNAAIDRLINFAKSQPNAGIWGGRTQFGNGSLNPASCWGRQTLWSLFCQAVGLSSLFRKSTLFNSEGIGAWDRTGVRFVDIVSGCFFLVRRDMWTHLGGFRKEFFMYGEEADLCLRAKAYGARPVVTSEATIIHYGGASERVRADKLVRLLRAKMLLIRMHFPPWSQEVGASLLAAWPLSRFLIHRLLVTLGRRESVSAKDAWANVLQQKEKWWVTPIAKSGTVPK